METSVLSLQLQYSGMQMIHDVMYFFASENKNVFMILNSLNLC